jgi:hypothetical protein
MGYSNYKARRQRQEQYAARYAREKARDADRPQASQASRIIVGLVVIALIATAILVYNLTLKPDCNPNDYGALGSPPASCKSHTP